MLAPLQDALTAIYWYKPDLRTFLQAAVGEPELIARLDFNQVKRQIVRDLVNILAGDQHKYFESLVSLVLAVADVKDPNWLRRVDGGEAKYKEAVESVDTLRLYADPYRALRTESEQALKRRQIEIDVAESRRAVSEKLAELNTLFASLHNLEPQPRGYALESLIAQLFTLFDIDSKESFRIHGEQIDGAFSLKGSEYLFEAKWQKALTPLSLDPPIRFGD